MDAAPAEAIAADTDTVAQGLAAVLDQIEPAFPGIYDDRTGSVVVREIHGCAGNGAGTATDAAAEKLEEVG